MVQHIKGEGCLGPREAGSKKISLKELEVMGRAICTNTPLHTLMAHSSTVNNNNIILQGGDKCEKGIFQYFIHLSYVLTLPS